MALKELRKRIADANGIPYEIEECRHEGECQGSCPGCDAEVKYIENALAEKEHRGEQVVRQDIMTDDELAEFLNKNAEGEEDVHAQENREEWAIRGEVNPIIQGEDREFRLQGVVHPRRAPFDLALKLIYELRSEHEGQNIVFSPYGISRILGMLRAGISPREDVYGIIDEWTREWRPFMSSPKFTLLQANGMWYDKSLGSVKFDFRKKMRRDFKAFPKKVDFKKVDAVNESIDKWVEENTAGMIKSLDLQITPYTFLVLANTLYLKAKWETPFDRNQTRPMRFHNADGSSPFVPMMRLRSDRIGYQSVYDGQIAMLHYEGSDYEMLVVLPDKDVDPHAPMRSLMVDGLWPEAEVEVDLMLPKFKVDSNLCLNDALRGLGLDALFDDDSILSRITDEPAHVGNVAQQCAISVDEEGTEAAAATHAECEVGCLPNDVAQRYHKMIVNRPFGFAIRKAHGPVLFMGVVNHLDPCDDLADYYPEKPEIKQILTSITVAGTSHVADIEQLADELYEGIELTLYHERDNKYDRNAIGLYLDDRRVGYVPREKNEILANLLDADVPLIAIVTQVAWQGKWLSIKADIALTE